MDLHERLAPNRTDQIVGEAGNEDPFAELKGNVQMLVIADLGPQLFNVADPDLRRWLNGQNAVCST